MARPINRTLKKPGQIGESATPRADAAKTATVKSATTRVADPKRVAAFKDGLSAESKAAAFLLMKGYRILARRFRSPVGEIDIVCGRRNTLVFVEVKTRATYDEAVEAVTPQQQRRIVAGAQYWLASRPQDAGREIRFDVVIMTPRKLPQHIPNAFDAGR